MLLKSKGVVLNTTKYGENSLISKVISDEKGLVTLISNRSKNKKNRQANYFQPLSAIQFVCYVSNKSSIYRVKEISFNSDVNCTSENAAVNALRFFLAELLSKVIREEEQNFTLYQFVESKISDLSNEKSELSNFHIYFLIELFNHIGIQPELKVEHSYFDMQEGSTSPTKPQHTDFYEGIQLKLLIKAFSKEGSLSKAERSSVLNLLINYCNIQLGGGLENLKSKAVLEVIFN
jgi:DNA repair protein RecO (recombination protein O)